MSLSLFCEASSGGGYIYLSGNARLSNVTMVAQHVVRQRSPVVVSELTDEGSHQVLSRGSRPRMTITFAHTQFLGLNTDNQGIDSDELKTMRRSEQYGLAAGAG